MPSMKPRRDSGTLRLAGLAALPALTILLFFAGRQAHGQAPTFYIPDPDEPKGTIEVRVTDPEGIPIAGAWVHFEWRSPRSLDRPDSGGDKTGDNGLLVRELPLGLWTVGASKLGHLPASVPPVEMTVGEVTRVELTLEPVEVTHVTVRVTGPAPAGGPGEIAAVAGASVRLSRSDGKEPRYSSYQTSDAQGRARFETVAEGTYGLFVKHELYPDQRFGDLPITLETEELAARLEGPPGGWAPVSGRVVRAGEGVAGVEITFYQQLRAESYHLETVSDEDGRFTLHAAPVGEYTIFWQPANDPDYPRLHRSDFQVGAPATRGLELPLPRGAEVRGRVVNPSDSGRPVTVGAAASRGSELTSHFVPVEVDDEGRFHLRHVMSGPWRITAKVQGRSVIHELTVPESAERAGDEIVIEAPLVLPAGHTVRGTVLRGDRPLEGARVVLCPCGNGPSGSFYSVGSTGPDGRFTILDVEAGDYDLRVKARNVGTVHEERVTVGPGTELTIEARPASVSGRVVDATSGEPVPGAKVRIDLLGVFDGEPNRHGVLVEDDGGFRLDPVRPGRWRFEVTASGYGITRREIDLEPEGDDSGDGEVTLELTPTAGLLLRVTMDDGRVPHRVSMRLVDPAKAVDGPWDAIYWDQPGTSYQGRPGDDGVLFWREAPAGRWMLDVRTEAHGLVRREVEISERVAGPPVEIVLPSVGHSESSAPDGDPR